MYKDLLLSLYVIITTQFHALVTNWVKHIVSRKNKKRIIIFIYGSFKDYGITDTCNYRFLYKEYIHSACSNDYLSHNINFFQVSLKTVL